jgi:hypothetical protein
MITVAQLLAQPELRRLYPGFSGARRSAQLSELAGVVVDLSPEQAGLVATIQQQLQDGKRPGGALYVTLEVADGATTPTVTSTSAPLLQAYRNIGRPIMVVRLYWPRFRFDMWSWFDVINRGINRGDAASIDAAFKGA